MKPSFRFLKYLLAILPFASLGQDQFQNPLELTDLDGLPSNRIMCVAEGSEGFSWLGTDNGFVRYDGAHVKTYYHSDEDSSSIASHFILHILPDDDFGILWLATLAGLSTYDPRNKTFKNYKHDPDNPNSVSDNRANRIFKDQDGTVWIGFRDGGMSRYCPETDDFVRYFCDNKKIDSKAPDCILSVVDIRQDLNDEDVLWLGTQSGIVRFEKSSGNHERFFYGQGKPKTTQNNTRCIFNHSNGKIYYGTWWDGVHVFDTATKEFSRLDACYVNGTDFFSRDVVLGFYPKTEHEFWINSTTGLQLYDTRTGCITKSYRNTDETSYSIDHIDKMGRTWSASRKHGLRIYDPLFQQCERIWYESLDYENDAYTRKVLEDTARKKILIMASRGRGLYILDQTTGEIEIIPPPDNYDMKGNGGFRSLDMEFIDDEGTVLIPEYKKFYHYKPGFKKLEPYVTQPPKGTSDLRKIMKGRDGKYWISCGTNLFRLDAETQVLTSFKKKLSELWNSTLGGDHMTEDIHGNIWIREMNGLLIFDKKNEQFIYHPYDPKTKLSVRDIGPMCADKYGGIWLATNINYLGYAHADSLETGVIRYFGKEDGMVDGKVFFVVEHGDKLILSKDSGVQFFDPKTMKMGKHYDARYGFGPGCNNVEPLSDGRLALGMRKYLAIFHPDSLTTNLETPRPYVSTFNVFDQSWPLNKLPGEIDTILLSYKQNFFSFDFSSIAYNLPADIRFEYKLEGFNENWVDGTKRKFAAYTNVPGGDYQFKVKAINNDGVSLSEPSITQLYISTVWWKTIWFWSLATLFLLGIGHLIYRWRIAQVRKEERMKAEYERKLTNVEMSALRAQMNPHFIFNCLNSIDYYIICNEQEKASDYLNRFSRLIRLILQNSKSTIVPLKDDLEALKLYIEMESLRFDNLFDYEVKMAKNIDPDSLKVPPMIMQPYVENAIWHGLMQKKGEKGKLDLTLRQSNGHLICLIEDNGIGREEAQQLKSKSASKRKSYGMKITSDRLAMLNKLASANASVQIFDLKNENGTAAGTRVELVIPL